jgi:hypothetical protein
MIIFQLGDGGPREAGFGTTQLSDRSFHEMFRQWQNIFHPLAQRRPLKRKSTSGDYISPWNRHT